MRPTRELLLLVAAVACLAVGDDVTTTAVSKDETTALPTGATLATPSPNATKGTENEVVIPKNAESSTTTTTDTSTSSTTTTPSPLTETTKVESTTKAPAPSTTAAPPTTLTGPTWPLTSGNNEGHSMRALTPDGKIYGRAADGSLEDETPHGCSLFCFIRPGWDEKMNFTRYHGLTECTHFVYGFSELKGFGWVKGGSTKDEDRDFMHGNYYRLRYLKRARKTSKVMLGIHLGFRGDSFISTKFDRQRIAQTLVNITEDFALDGVFLKAERPFLDHPHFVGLMQELAVIKMRNTTGDNQPIRVPVHLGVPLHQMTFAADKMAEAAEYVDTIHLLPSPSLRRIEELDPLTSTPGTPAEKTISHHVQVLAAKGVPKHKIIVDLSASAVVYKNFIYEEIGDEAQGSMVPYQSTCPMHGNRAMGHASASEFITFYKTKVSTNVPSEGGMGKKVRWVSSSGYGGVGIFGIESDDPLGTCNNVTFPLLRMAESNLQCNAHASAAIGCTRLCYLKEALDLKKLPKGACSHIVVDATLSVVGDVKLTPAAFEIARSLMSAKMEKKPRLLVSLGSASTSDVWRYALAMQYTRSVIITQLKTILTEWRGVGVEISWTAGPLNFPGDQGILRDFIVEMRRAFADAKTLIAFAVTSEDSQQKRYDNIKLNETVDYVVLHTHRFHNARMPFTGHHAPLFYDSAVINNPAATVKGLVEHWASILPRSKLIMGMTAEPLSMSLINAVPAVRGAKANSDNDEEDLPLGKKAFPFIAPLGTARSAGSQKKQNVREVCEEERSGESRVTFLDPIGVPFLVTKDNEFVAYENERSVQMKSTWASLELLGGIAMFGVELDNPEGACPTTAFPLLKALAKTQVCSSCVPDDDVTPCDTAFTTSCSFRLALNGERNPMPATKIPFTDCKQVVIEQMALKDDGTVAFADTTAEGAMKEMSALVPRMNLKRMVASIRCDMKKSTFREMLDNKGALFIHGIVKFLSKHGFHGVELACDHIVESEDRTEFGRFLAALRDHLHETTPNNRCPHTLSLRIPVTRRPLRSAYDVDVVNTLRHVVLEPFNDPNTPDVTHLNSPLFASGTHHDDIATTIDGWETEGIELSKILIQIPAAATLQTIASSNGSALGMATKNTLVIGQSQVCELVKDATPTVLYDRMAVYHITSPTRTQGRRWLATQNQDTIAYKIMYAIREGLGGIGLLALNGDDWSGSCHAGTFPLLKATSARCGAL